MTERVIFGIGERRWWIGGGYDVLQGPGPWPLKLAWFREKHHAEIFAEVLQGKWMPRRIDGENVTAKEEGK